MTSQPSASMARFPPTPAQRAELGPWRCPELQLETELRHWVAGLRSPPIRPSPPVTDKLLAIRREAGKVLKAQEDERAS